MRLRPHWSLPNQSILPLVIYTVLAMKKLRLNLLSVSVSIFVDLLSTDMSNIFINIIKYY